MQSSHSKSLIWAKSGGRAAGLFPIWLFPHCKWRSCCFSNYMEVVTGHLPLWVENRGGQLWTEWWLQREGSSSPFPKPLPPLRFVACWGCFGFIQQTIWTRAGEFMELGTAFSYCLFGYFIQLLAISFSISFLREIRWPFFMDALSEIPLLGVLYNSMSLWS